MKEARNAFLTLWTAVRKNMKCSRGSYDKALVAAHTAGRFTAVIKLRILSAI
jgi:hypothetical protein